MRDAEGEWLAELAGFPGGPWDTWTNRFHPGEWDPAGQRFALTLTRAATAAATSTVGATTWIWAADGTLIAEHAGEGRSFGVHWDAKGLSFNTTPMNGTPALSYGRDGEALGTSPERILSDWSRDRARRLVLVEGRTHLADTAGALLAELPSRSRTSHGEWHPALDLVYVLSADGRFTVWRADGQRIGVVDPTASAAPGEESDTPFDACWHPTKPILYTTGDPKGLREWPVDPDALLETVDKLVPQPWGDADDARYPE